MSLNAVWPFKLFPELLSDFVLARRVDDFGQFASTLYILQRVPPPLATACASASCSS